MHIVSGLVIGIVAAGLLLLALFEYRIRQPDVIVLYESQAKIAVRHGLLYPRHFSLPLKRTTCPLQLTVEAAAVGNLIVRVKLVGSAAPSVEHIQALIRVGGWDSDAVSHAVDQVKFLLQGLVKEFTEVNDIQAITSPAVLQHLRANRSVIEERFGVELIALAVHTLEPIDPKISEALSQQEEARLLEQTEQLNHQAARRRRQSPLQGRRGNCRDGAHPRTAPGGAEKSSVRAGFAAGAPAHRGRAGPQPPAPGLREGRTRRPAQNPELLMLTPQAARLAEASQSLKNARTIISLTPQELANGSALFTLFRNMLQKELESKDQS